MATDLSDYSLLDLSNPIHPGMWNYDPILPPVTNENGEDVPPQPPVQVNPLTTIAKDGYSIDEFIINGLSGAYVETSAHMNPDGPLLNQLSPQHFIRPAKVMRLPVADEPYRLYTPDDLRKAAPELEEGDCLMMLTGWKLDPANPDAYVTQGPALSFTCLEWFLEHPIAIWASDLTVGDCLWGKDHGHPEQDGKDMLGELYKARPGLMLVAPLLNTDKIKHDVGTIIAPGLSVPGVCATPSRVLYLDGAAIQLGVPKLPA